MSAPQPEPYNSTHRWQVSAMVDDMPATAEEVRLAVEAEGLDPEWIEDLNDDGSHGLYLIPITEDRTDAAFTEGHVKWTVGPVTFELEMP